MFLGKQIKDIRKRKGLTQKELAKELGISANALCSIENGYACPTGMTMEKICKVLDVELKLIENE